MPKLDPNFEYKFKKDDPLIVKVKMYNLTDKTPTDHYKSSKELGDKLGKRKFVVYGDQGYNLIILGTNEQLSRIEGKEIYIVPTNWSKKELMDTVQYELGGNPENNLSGHKVSKIQEGNVSGADDYARITSIHEPETFTFSNNFSAKESLIEKLDKVIEALEGKCNFDGASPHIESNKTYYVVADAFGGTFDSLKIQKVFDNLKEAKEYVMNSGRNTTKLFSFKEVKVW